MYRKLNELEIKWIELLLVPSFEGKKLLLNNSRML